MSSLSQLRHGLNRVWDSVSEGWQHLSRGATQALTHFNPSAHADDADAVHSLLKQSSRWGLLTAEVEEKTDEIIVRLEVPGMEADDFDIEVVEPYLVIRGEKRATHKESKSHYAISECAYGRFERALELPAKVDDSKAKAKYKRGVLRVELPKREKNEKSRITVKPS